MKKFSFECLMNIIDRIEHEEICSLCEKKKQCECKDKKPKDDCPCKHKKEVR